MTNEEVRSHNAALVDAIKAEVERIQCVRNAAPQMLKVLKYLNRKSGLGMEAQRLIYDAIRVAEGKSN